MGEGPSFYDDLMLVIIFSVVGGGWGLGLGLDNEGNIASRGWGGKGLVLVQGSLGGCNINSEAGVGLPIVGHIPTLLSTPSV